ncbi:MAG: hypothetical protein V4532_13320, partial [Pseudomonadota bacterium]
MTASDKTALARDPGVIVSAIAWFLNGYAFSNQGISDKYWLKLQPLAALQTRDEGHLYSTCVRF